MENKGFNYYIGFFFRSLLQGLVILGPIAATIGLIWYLVSSIDNIIPTISERFPGLVFISVIFTTSLVGFMGTKFLLGRILVDAINNLLEHTPGIKYVYSSLKDVMSSFVGDKKKFNKPVWVKINDKPEIWRIGFLTQDDLSPVGLKEKIAVYLPHSYAISGWVILTEMHNIRKVEGMNSAQAMKFAVSGGVSGFYTQDTSHKATESV
ncbi:DUF502 domain-containing protein [Elizabethkingia argentiflava]|uniref:DUF502 domain-containing protein n=1 Tax=Elizabethkingia argenteiflava TaxID=2681556 RepID=A0A845PZM2_9FLAO|nr:DUF502 domain-containing protein [Elizabethkingia argenteiflava]NAW51530.1 DUF502 domain-containing protein [Elizabethkingia argenteiflava]